MTDPTMMERLARAVQQEMQSVPNCNSGSVCTLPPCECSDRIVRAILTELRQIPFKTALAANGVPIERDIARDDQGEIGFRVTAYEAQDIVAAIIDSILSEKPE